MQSDQSKADRNNAQRNKDLYRRFIQEVFNEGRLDRVRNFTAPAYVVREAHPDAPNGPDGIAYVASMFRAGFPDLDITLDTLIGEGEWIAARSTLRGTHQGTIFGIEATGRSVAARTAATSPASPDASSARAPVTPVRET